MCGEQTKFAGHKLLGFLSWHVETSEQGYFPITWGRTFCQGVTRVFLSRRITFWTGTVASYRAPVDVNMSGHGTSKVDDKADTNSL